MALSVDQVVAQELNITLYEGDAQPVRFKFEDAAQTPKSLLGASIKISLKNRLSDAAAVYDLSLQNGRIVLTGAGNNIAEVPTWDFIKAGRYYYDFRIKWPGGVRITYFFGTVTVVKGERP